MYYPKMLFKKGPTKTRPNILIVGDSFVWTWLNTYEYFPNLFNEKSSFWYYNHNIEWGPGSENKTLIKDLNFKEVRFSRLNNALIVQCF